MKSRTILIYLASIVIILAGLKAASGVVVPFLLAVFIAVIISPLMKLLQKLKIPRLISFLFVAFVFFGVLGLFGNIIFEAIREFSSELPNLQEKGRVIMDNIIVKAEKYGINIDYSMLGFDANSIAAATGSLLKQTSSIAKTSLFVLLMVAFMLFESVLLADKLEYLERINPGANEIILNYIANLKRYLLIKTIASAVTGLLIGFGLYILGVPYAPLWGIVAFLLNYIPTIGSIVAAIPTLFIALTMNNFAIVFWVFVIYLTVNMIIGNIIEPRFLGEGLDISPVVVLLSLLLWGFVFGIGGMFLAVPLTMSIQIALRTNPKTKFIALFLGNKVENPKDIA